MPSSFEGKLLDEAELSACFVLFRYSGCQNEHPGLGSNGGVVGIGCYRSEYSLREGPLGGRVVEDAPGNRKRRITCGDDHQLPGLYLSRPPAEAKRAGSRA